MMILVFRILNYNASKLTDIAAGIIMTVIQTVTMFWGEPTIYYLFFSLIKIFFTIIFFVVVFQWIETSIKQNL